jgi:hypothetical protein
MIVQKETVQKEVPIESIKSSPFRRLKEFPLNEGKIEKMRSSIRRTGLWPNIQARKVGDDYELAAGHHRVEAARREKMKVVGLNVGNYDDATMLAMMAADNDEAWDMNPSFILETVKGAKSFFEKGLIPPTSAVKHKCFLKESDIEHWIHTFLDWPRHRVTEALAQLAAIEKGTLASGAIKHLPSEHAAVKFTQAVKKAASVGQPISAKQQVAAAKQMKQSRRNIDVPLPQPRRKPFKIEFEDKEEEETVKRLAAQVNLSRKLAQVRCENRDQQRKLALEIVNTGYKALSQVAHPDKGGSESQQQNLNVTVRWLRKIIEVSSI